MAGATAEGGAWAADSGGVVSTTTRSQHRVRCRWRGGVAVSRPPLQPFPRHHDLWVSPQPLPILCESICVGAAVRASIERALGEPVIPFVSRAGYEPQCGSNRRRQTYERRSPMSSQLAIHVTDHRRLGILKSVSRVETYEV